MRVIPGLVFSLYLLVPALASGQSLEVHGSAGPTLIDAGHSLAAGAGLFPTSHLSLLFGVERTHLSSRLSSDGRSGTTAFRGGTVTLGTAELRGALFGGGRLTPYALAGVAAGVSRPNVNETFPNRVSHRVRAFFLGGGITVPAGQQISVFADARVIVGAEAGETLGLAPLRAGVAWRF